MTEREELIQIIIDHPEIATLISSFIEEYQREKARILSIRPDTTEEELFPLFESMAEKWFKKEKR